MPELSNNWSADWNWSLPLILFTVLVHGFGLLLIRERIIVKLERAAGSSRVHALFAIRGLMNELEAFRRALISPGSTRAKTQGR